MGIAPVPGIRGVGPANTTLVEREVEPAFAMDRSERMQDDAYKGSQESAERGMEEEDSDPAKDLSADETPIASYPDARVNFFA